RGSVSAARAARPATARVARRAMLRVLVAITSPLPSGWESEGAWGDRARCAKLPTSSGRGRGKVPSPPPPAPPGTGRRSAESLRPHRVGGPRGPGIARIAPARGPPARQSLIYSRSSWGARVLVRGLRRGGGEAAAGRPGVEGA